MLRQSCEGTIAGMIRQDKEEIHAGGCKVTLPRQRLALKGLGRHESFLGVANKVRKPGQLGRYFNFPGDRPFYSVAS